MDYEKFSFNSIQVRDQQSEWIMNLLYPWPIPFFVCVFVFVIILFFFCHLAEKIFAVIYKLKKILHVYALNCNDWHQNLKNDALNRIAHDDYIVTDTYIPRHRCKNTWTLWTRGPYCEDLFGLYPGYLCKQTYTTT